MDRYRRTNPQNSSKIIQRAVDAKARDFLAAIIRNAQSTGLSRPPASKQFTHLQHRRKKAAQMQDEWNRIVTENVRLLERTREIALRDNTGSGGGGGGGIGGLPPMGGRRPPAMHKSLNEPFMRKKKASIKKYNYVLGNRLYRAKPTVDTRAPKFMHRFADERSGCRGGGARALKATRKKKKKKKKVLRSAEGVDMSDSPFAPGRPFTGEVIRLRAHTSGW